MDYKIKYTCWDVCDGLIKSATIIVKNCDNYATAVTKLNIYLRRKFPDISKIDMENLSEYSDTIKQDDDFLTRWEKIFKMRMR